SVRRRPRAPRSETPSAAAWPLASFLLRQDAGRLDLHQGAVLEQIGDLHQRHGGKMLAHAAAPGLAHRVERGLVGLLVLDVDRHAGHVLGTATRGADHLENVGERAVPLLAEIVRTKLLVFVPAHLAGDEEDAALGQDPVGVAPRPLPARRFDDAEEDHGRTSPPSTPESCPVSPPAAGSARKTSARATSPGRISRPIGFMRASWARASSVLRPVVRTMFSTAPSRRSVSVHPGQTALTVIPFAATSTARARVIPTRACLLAVYPAV